MVPRAEDVRAIELGALGGLPRRSSAFPGGDPPRGTSATGAPRRPSLPEHSGGVFSDPLRATLRFPCALHPPSRPPRTPSLGDSRQSRVSHTCVLAIPSI